MSFLFVHLLSTLCTPPQSRILYLQHGIPHSGLGCSASIHTIKTQNSPPETSAGLPDRYDSCSQRTLDCVKHTGKFIQHRLFPLTVFPLPTSPFLFESIRDEWLFLSSIRELSTGLTHTSEMTLGPYTRADWYGRYLGLKTHLVATAKASHLLAAVSAPTQGSQLREGPESMDKPSPPLCPHSSVVC